MTTFTISCGAEKPIKAVGKNQCSLLAFAEKYRGWHSYKKDRATTRAVAGLEKKGLLEVIPENCQFRFKYPDLHKLKEVSTLQDWRDANPEPVHGCGHMQGRGAA